MRLEDGKVVLRPITTKARFIKELRGCVESSKIDPLEVKRIWNRTYGMFKVDPETAKEIAESEDLSYLDA